MRGIFVFPLLDLTLGFDVRARARVLFGVDTNHLSFNRTQAQSVRADEMTVGTAAAAGRKLTLVSIHDGSVVQ